MSFAITSVAMQGVGMLTSAFGSYMSAKNAKLNMEGQAAIASINAGIVESAGAAAASAASAAGAAWADAAMARGEREVRKVEREAANVKGEMRAKMAARGLDLAEGSPVEAQASLEYLKEQEIDDIREEAIRSAWGYSANAEADAASIRANTAITAANYRMEGIAKSAAASSISPGTAAFSSLLGGASVVADEWYGLYKEGAF